MTARVLTWRSEAAVELRSGDTTAIVLPQLGMLIASFTVDGAEFVARPGGLRAARAGHTTAIPLLYPWANRLARSSYRAEDRTVSLRGRTLHRDANGLAMHGTMAARPEWEITALGRTGLRAQFDFGAHDDLLASFPFPHSLAVSVSVGARWLRVVTEVRATAGSPVPIAFGWHPYWQVPGARDAWTLRTPELTHLALDGRGIPTRRAAEAEGANKVGLIGRAFDDLYAFTSRRSVTLVGGAPRNGEKPGQLRLDLDDGYPYLQVYAPPASRFCCLEPMTAPTNALVTGDHQTVVPGERFAAAFTARVS